MTYDHFVWRTDLILLLFTSKHNGNMLEQTCLQYMICFMYAWRYCDVDKSLNEICSLYEAIRISSQDLD